MAASPSGRAYAARDDPFMAFAPAAMAFTILW
jgi:hypothetical protein